MWQRGQAGVSSMPVAVPREERSLTKEQQDKVWVQRALLSPPITEEPPHLSPYSSSREGCLVGRSTMVPSRKEHSPPPTHILPAQPLAQHIKVCCTSSLAQDKAPKNDVTCSNTTSKSISPPPQKLFFTLHTSSLAFCTCRDAQLMPPESFPQSPQAHPSGGPGLSFHSRGRQMDLTGIKHPKMRFCTLFQRETIPQLSHWVQACEGGEQRLFMGS